MVGNSTNKNTKKLRHCRVAYRITFSWIPSPSRHPLTFLILRGTKKQLASFRTCEFLMEKIPELGEKPCQPHKLLQPPTCLIIIYFGFLLYCNENCSVATVDGARITLLCHASSRYIHDGVLTPYWFLQVWFSDEVQRDRRSLGVTSTYYFNANCLSWIHHPLSFVLWHSGRVLDFHARGSGSRSYVSCQIFYVSNCRTTSCKWFIIIYIVWF